MFPELEIETTITYLLWKFHKGDIPLPLEVELCIPGSEALGWRQAAINKLKIAAEAKQKRETLVIN